MDMQVDSAFYLLRIIAQQTQNDNKEGNINYLISSVHVVCFIETAQCTL